MSKILKANTADLIQLAREITKIYPQTDGDKSIYAFCGSFGTDLFLAGGNYASLDGSDIINIGPRQDLVRKIGDIDCYVIDNETKFSSIPINELSIDAQAAIKEGKKCAKIDTGYNEKKEYIGLCSLGGEDFVILNPRNMFSYKLFMGLGRQEKEKHIYDIKNLKEVYKQVFYNKKVQECFLSELLDGLFTSTFDKNDINMLPKFVGKEINELLSAYGNPIFDEHKLAYIQAVHGDAELKEDFDEIKRNKISKEAEEKLLHLMFLTNKSRGKICKDSYRELLKIAKKYSFSDEIIASIGCNLSGIGSFIINDTGQNFNIFKDILDFLKKSNLNKRALDILNHYTESYGCYACFKFDKPHVHDRDGDISFGVEHELAPGEILISKEEESKLFNYLTKISETN